MSNTSLLQTKLILSSAQLLNLNTNPVLVIPGVVGCLIDVQSIYFRYIHGTTPFNPSSSDGFVFFNGSLENALTAINPIQASGFIDQSSDQSAWGAPVLSGLNGAGDVSEAGAIALSAIEGIGLYLTQYNVDDSFPTGANWTDGNGSLAVFLRWAYVQVGGL